MFDTYRVAVVTGATSGIGRATVEALRERGLTVYAVGRNETVLHELQQASGAISIRADVRDVAAIAGALEGVEVDVLVNNAGILSTRAPFQDMDPSEIDSMIDINLKAPMHLTRVVVPGMVARKRGHLIYIGSSGGQSAYPNMGAYGASKAGLSLFCDNLRCDLLGTSVRVSEIVPGRVETSLYRTSIPGGQAKALLYDGYRSIQPENIAKIITDVISLPGFVDVSRLEVFPTDQAAGGGTMVKADQN
ncbi:SDR family oxidoreductase [Rhizobium sp. CFBP 8762]|uniref:SDR family oxidoreductase n=1 Tax=Rhizobium sp. CFBP 8762 TaxID=2775279 RepID=UPI00177F559D|nr:SDR family oxidoreductase [Rhizobium sp. CFBP 8762]MBD8554991.1 SDR family oxidoreductase [Rhizobium sp. CFBP 8762]